MSDLIPADGKFKPCRYCGHGVVNLRLSEGRATVRQIECAACLARGPAGKTYREAWHNWNGTKELDP